MEEYYDIFAELLEEERVYMDPGLTFDSICRWIGVSRADFDMYLMSETGEFCYKTVLTLLFYFIKFARMRRFDAQF